MAIGPAQHASSGARAEAADLPAPVFTIRGRVRLLSLDVYVEGGPGIVSLQAITYAGGGVVRDLFATRLPMRPDSEALVLAPMAPEGELLHGFGTIWALDPAASGARLWVGLLLAADARRGPGGNRLNLPFAGPLAIDPADLARLEAQLEAAQRFVPMAAARAPRPSRRETVGRGAIAVVPLFGLLTQKPSLFSLFGVGTSIEEFTEAVVSALRDPGVSAVVMDVDSPGGEVFGLQEAAQRIRAARGSKPLVAVANPIIASAAYHIASQAEAIVGTPSGLLGSIGVFMVHVDRSGQLAQEGLRVTLIAFGARKAEGSELGPMSAQARAAAQERVDEFGEQFLADVAAGRRVSVSTVRANYGEGAVFTSRRAVGAGLADLIGSREQLLRQLASGIPVERTRPFDPGALRAHAILADVSLDPPFDPRMLMARYIAAGLPVPDSLRGTKTVAARR